MKLATLATVGLLTVVANIVGYIFCVWLLASAVTSGVKSFSKQCGTVYGVEKYYVNGDFFCGK